MHRASHHLSAGTATIAVVQLVRATGSAEDQPPIPFVVDACENLRVLRGMHGRRGAPYLRQLRRYRAIADTLGCRSALERRLHPLHQRPIPIEAEGHMPPWRRRDGASAALTE